MCEILKVPVSVKVPVFSKFLFFRAFQASEDKESEERQTRDGGWRRKKC